MDHPRIVNLDTDDIDVLAENLDRTGWAAVNRLDWPPLNVLRKSLKKRCKLPFTIEQDKDRFILLRLFRQPRSLNPWFNPVKDLAGKFVEARVFDLELSSRPVVRFFLVKDFLQALRLEQNRSNEMSVAFVLKQLDWTKRRLRANDPDKGQAWCWFPPGWAPGELDERCLEPESTTPAAPDAAAEDA
jgi:hypothetical protein